MVCLLFYLFELSHPADHETKIYKKIRGGKFFFILLNKEESKGI